MPASSSAFGRVSVLEFIYFVKHKSIVVSNFVILSGVPVCSSIFQCSERVSIYYVCLFEHNDHIFDICV